MKKNLLLSVLLLLPLYLNQCSPVSQDPAASKETKSVQIAIKTPDNFDSIANTAYVKVSAYDMDTISSLLNIYDTMISGEVQNIPVGHDRLFEVFVEDYYGNILYYGDAYADIKPGRTTYVNITLRKPSGGSAVIIGTIEDIPQNEYLNVGTPFVTGVYRDSLDSSSVLVMMQAYGSSSSGCGIEYSWSINASDSFVKTDWRHYGDFTIKLPLNCDVMAGVRVRCAEHEIYMGSDSLVFKIRNGFLVTDTIINPPNPYPDTLRLSLSAMDTFLLDVQPGDTVTFYARGSWCLSNYNCTGPNGIIDDSLPRSIFQYPELPGGALLGLADTSLFLIGEYSTFIANTNGITLLCNRYTPDRWGRESGAIEIDVIISKERLYFTID